MAAFVLAQKVRFQHCDPAGIVFYPRYFEMVNTTVEDWFEALGLSFAEMHGPAGGGVPAASIRADFRAPSRLGEVLDFALTPVRLGRSSCEVRLVASCDGETRAEFGLTLVWIEFGTGRSRPWPEGLRAAISAAMEGGGA